MQRAEAEAGGQEGRRAGAEAEAEGRVQTGQGEAERPPSARPIFQHGKITFLEPGGTCRIKPNHLDSRQKTRTVSVARCARSRCRLKPTKIFGLFLRFLALSQLSTSCTNVAARCAGLDHSSIVKPPRLRPIPHDHPTP